MSSIGIYARAKAILKAWPLPGAFLLFLSFAVSAVWLYDGLFGLFDEEIGWFEPLSAIFGGLGAFILAAVLIFRRVDNARAAASNYDLSRGLATGYYFNFVRPLLRAMGNPEHALHAQVRALGGERIAGILVGIPQEGSEFDPENHQAIFDTLAGGPDGPYTITEIKVVIEKRPRPVVTRVAVSASTKSAVLVDIPTTLAVIIDFAEHLAQSGSEGGAADDEFVHEARKSLVTAAESDRFRVVLEEFVDVINKAGSTEARPMSPALRLHIVSVNRLRRRLDELAGN
jgi:hypothetical protein